MIERFILALFDHIFHILTIKSQKNTFFKLSPVSVSRCFWPKVEGHVDSLICWERYFVKLVCVIFVFNRLHVILWSLGSQSLTTQHDVKSEHHHKSWGAGPCQNMTDQIFKMMCCLVSGLGGFREVNIYTKYQRLYQH